MDVIVCLWIWGEIAENKQENKQIFPVTESRRA